MRYLKIYRQCIRVSVGRALTYRANFILSSVIMLISNILFPLVTVLIYRSDAGFSGWSFWEVLLIQSTFTMAMGIANCMFFGILWATMQNIVDGTFEIILIKPVNPMFYMLASTFEIDSFGLFLGGLVLFVLAVCKVGTMTLAGWCMFALFFIAGIFVLLGVALLMAAVSFKWVGNSRIPEIFTSITDIGKYPQSIFPKSVVLFTSYIMPVGMIGFFPASALLNRMHYGMVFAVIPCVLFAILGILIYIRMIRLYEGAGS